MNEHHKSAVEYINRAKSREKTMAPEKNLQEVVYDVAETPFDPVGLEGDVPLDVQVLLRAGLRVCGYASGDIESWDDTKALLRDPVMFRRFSSFPLLGTSCPGRLLRLRCRLFTTRSGSLRCGADVVASGGNGMRPSKSLPHPSTPLFPHGRAILRLAGNTAAHLTEESIGSALKMIHGIDTESSLVLGHVLGPTVARFLVVRARLAPQGGASGSISCSGAALPLVADAFAAYAERNILACSCFAPAI